MTKGGYMTKAEMIERYGAEWYESFKTRQREQIRERYHANIDASREYCRAKYQRYRKQRKRYSKERRVIYNINTRDRIRLATMGLIPDGMEVHHLKYHIDTNDEKWIDDVVVMTREEHRKWHREHPDFKATEHIV